MFEPKDFSFKIFRDRYALTEEETWAEACLRVAQQMASAEHREVTDKYRDKFYDELVSNRFVPGGRIWYNSGRPNPQLLNCFVLRSALDSKEGWGDLSREMIITSMTGGGCGIDFSDVRPRGASIKGQRGSAPGPVELMKLINNSGDPIRAGGVRRTALMFSLDLDHPSIMEFLDTKLTHGELQLANISIRCKNVDKFINAVVQNLEWELQWKGQYKESVNARDLWNKVVENAYNSAEPGFLNWELALSESTIYYIEDLVTTNPCIVGDTLIATADGRNAVSIAQLATEEKDVPVYSTNPTTGQVQIKIGRNPRKTGIKKEVWELHLDDGSKLRATPDHKILKSNLEYIELKHLKPGDSIKPFNSFSNNGYRQVCETGAQMSGGRFRNRRQYRLIHEFYNGDTDGKQFAIHHADNNKLNDNILNLCKMSHKAHQQIHDISGDKNPMRSGKINWELYHTNMSKATKGERNGRYCGTTNEELVVIGKELFQKHGKLTRAIWVKHAKENNLPRYFSKFRFDGSFNNFKNLVSENHKVVSASFVGYEDVYNITVDDNNNYHVITSTDDDKYIISSGICIKNCGEIALSEHDCCCLGHLVLPRFINDSGIDWELLGETIRVAVRFLDNVLSVNHFPLPEMKIKSEKLRRIGLGTTGLADMLALLGYKYGSADANKFVDKLYRFVSKMAYEASVMLAVEKGPFPACKPALHVKSGYVKRMTPKIKSLIKEHGIRNCALLTQAPTGTVSIMSGNCSSGVEPMFATAYERRFWKDDKRETELVFHPLFADFMKQGKDVSHFVAAHELSVEGHMKIQAIIQKHLDNAVSKTINMPEDYPMKDMAEMWLKYLPVLKGTTFYRENSRKFVGKDSSDGEPPLKPLSLDEAQKRFNDKQGLDLKIHTEEQKCKGGMCEL